TSTVGAAAAVESSAVPAAPVDATFSSSCDSLVDTGGVATSAAAAAAAVPSSPCEGAAGAPAAAAVSSEDPAPAAAAAVSPSPSINLRRALLSRSDSSSRVQYHAPESSPSSTNQTSARRDPSTLPS
ncbi:unnamed protein product, partial [Ectocarpus fasciculatus]